MSGIRWGRLGVAALALSFVVAACDDPSPTNTVSELDAPEFYWGEGVVNDEEFELCKVDGPAEGTWFNVDVRDESSGTAIDNFDVMLTPGQCMPIWGDGGASEVVTVTEYVPDGWSTPSWEKEQCVTPAATGDWCEAPGTVITVTNGIGTQVSGIVGGDGGDGYHEGVLLTFTNVPGNLVGRMTGGGPQMEMLTVGGDEVKITRGFTLHCDITLSNNLEINWPDNKWHLDKPITFAHCTDEPGINPEPPPAPFDTFYGEGYGKLNGVDGAYIEFTFQDAGEPGGGSDKSGISIWAPGADPSTDVPVLYVPFDYMEKGNLQAHYDQPHGCNVNNPC